MNNSTAFVASISTPAFVGSIVMLVVGVLGLFGNVIILLASWHSRASLNAKSNWLIAALATCDVLSNIMGFGVSIIGFVDKFPISQCMCFYKQMPMVFSINAGAAMIFMVGLDRLLALCVPVKYRNWLNRHYVPIMCMPAMLFGVSNLIAAWAAADCQLKVFVCIPPTAFNAGASTYFVGSNVVVCLMVTFVCLFDGTVPCLSYWVRWRRRIAHGNEQAAHAAVSQPHHGHIRVHQVHHHTRQCGHQCNWYDIRR